MVTPMNCSPAMHVRLICPDDEAAYRSILERTSDDDRYFRFFHVVKAFGPAEIRHFVEARPDMIGVIAFEGQSALGAAHAALLDDRTAELSVVVAEDRRRRGVGNALLATLMRELEDRGYVRFVAQSLHDNHGFARLARSAGFRAQQVEGSAVAWVCDAGPRVLAS